MIVAAAVCRSPPLLIPELTGAKQVATELRRACHASVAELTAAAPEVIALVGAAERSRTWNGAATFDLARYAPGMSSRAAPLLGSGAAPRLSAGAGQGPDPGPAGLPSALGVGNWLLDQAGCQVIRVLQSVAQDEAPARCADIGARLAASRGRVALLVMADGSARRGLKAPGYLDGRSTGFDAEVERAVRTGRLEALLSADPALAHELMATGRPAWQVLAGALRGRKVSSEVRYRDDPFGVAYLVASLRVLREPCGAEGEPREPGMAEQSYGGRSVLIFGAAGALGAGVAAAFAAAGASVTGVHKTQPAAERRLAKVSSQSADVLVDEAVGELFDSAPAPWAVINTVGSFVPRRPFAELDPAELIGQLEVNLVTAALITKHALRVMQPAGEGRIVHTASRAGVVTKGAGFAYSVSKLGVLHLVSMAADDVRGTGVTVNCVVPSIIDTPVNRAAMPSANHDSWPKVPDIARTYLFLAAPESGLVNGAAIPV